MSKSNQKYGKTLWSGSFKTEASPKPSNKLVKSWNRLDTVARKLYGKQYDALQEQEKVAVHFQINTERSQRRERQAAKDADIDAKHDQTEGQSA